jgi:hypothetical protein
VLARLLAGKIASYRAAAGRIAAGNLASWQPCQRAGLQVGLQVKRSDLPVRFSKSAWSRLHGDARRLGWRWLVAVVTSASQVYFFDPSRARLGRAVTLTEGHALDNVLEWLEAK